MITYFLFITMVYFNTKRRKRKNTSNIMETATPLLIQYVEVAVLLTVLLSGQMEG